MENGIRRFLPRTVRLLCYEYGLDDATRDRLVSLAEEAEPPGLWERAGEAVPEGFMRYLGLETEADWIHVWQAEVVPELLQTEGYARGLYPAGRCTGRPDEIEKRIRLRMARQERFDSDDPPRFCCVLGETALRQQIGGADTLRRQLDHLVRMAGHPSVTLQVLPYRAGGHAAVNGSFTRLGADTSPPLQVAYVEHNTGNLYLDGPGDVATYAAIFEIQRTTALSPAQSLAFIHELAEDRPR
jgi:hypothetical protein